MRVRGRSRLHGIGRSMAGEDRRGRGIGEAGFVLGVDLTGRVLIGAAGDGAALVARAAGAQGDGVADRVGRDVAAVVQAGAGFLDPGTRGDVAIQILTGVHVDAGVDGRGGQIVAARLGDAVHIARVAAQGQGGVRHCGALHVLGRTDVGGAAFGAAGQGVAHGGVRHGDVVADVDDVQALTADDVAKVELLIQDQPAILSGSLSGRRYAQRCRGDRASETGRREFGHCSCPCLRKRDNSRRWRRQGCRPAGRWRG